MDRYGAHSLLSACPLGGPDSLPYGEHVECGRESEAALKKLLMASVIGMLAVTAPISAHADGVGYTGGCRISTVNDTTPDATLGGQNVWNGQVNILVIASTPGATITGSCSIKVNGTPQGTILTATQPGVGFAANAGRATFTSAVTDTVSLCTDVTVGGVASPQVCVDLTTTPVCPVQVCGPGGVLDQVNAILALVDPTLCAQLIAISGTVDSLPTAGVLYIDPATGDTYVGGTGPSALFWDCPPYVVTP
jgi:hypothetical protein